MTEVVQEILQRIEHLPETDRLLLEQQLAEAKRKRKALDARRKDLPQWSQAELLAEHKKGRESLRKPAETKYECNPKKSLAASSSGLCTYAHEFHARAPIHQPGLGNHTCLGLMVAW